MEQNSLRNAHDVERYIVCTGRHYFGDFLAYEFSRQYAEWASLSERLHGSGRPKQDSFYLDLMRNPGEARKFTLAGFELIEVQWLISHQLGKITARKATGYTT